MKSEISYIIPAFRCLSTLERCLESIPKEREIIVIGRGDIASIRSLLDKFPKVIFSEIKAIGAAKARNLGASLASGDYLAFLDADTYLLDGFEEPKDLLEFDLFMYSIEFEVSDNRALPKYLQARKNLTNKMHFGSALRGYFLYLDSAFTIIERKIFMASGGFCESLLRYEDRELGYRLQLAGLRICLVKKAGAIKVIDETNWELLVKKIKDLFYQSKTIFTIYSKHQAYIPESKPFYIFIDELRIIFRLNQRMRWLQIMCVLTEFFTSLVLKIFFTCEKHLIKIHYAKSSKFHCLIAHGPTSVFKQYQGKE